MKFFVVDQVVATNRLDSSNERFSEQAMEELAQSANCKPILQNFDPTAPVGRIISAKKEGDIVKADFVVYLDAEFDFRKDWYVVPSFVVRKFSKKCTDEGIMRIFEKVEAVSFALTTRPTDQNLEPIKFNS